MFLPGLIFIAKFVSVAIASWLLIHILSIFGLFIAFTYPIWWFISPESTWCLYCRSRKRAAHCPLCKATPSVDNYHPKNLRSIFWNSALVILFTFTSVLLVFGEFHLLNYISTVTNNRTATFNVADRGKYMIGEVFPMEIIIENLKVPINTVQVDLGFDSNVLEAVEVSTEGSFATVFVDNDINNEYGMVRLTGGLPNPGYKGEKAFFGTVYFKAKTPGIAQVDFLPTSVVLANDGNGTNVLRYLNPASFLIVDDPIGEPIDTDEKVTYKGDYVLGESWKEPQLHLYSSGDKVLGLSAGDETDDVDDDAKLVTDTVEENPSFFRSVLNIVIKVDHAIVSIWERMLELIGL